MKGQLSQRGGVYPSPLFIYLYPDLKLAALIIELEHITIGRLSLNGAANFFYFTFVFEI